jgi:cholesterol transport system auxiliary component
MSKSRNCLFCYLLMLLSVGACSGLTHSDQPATVKWWLKPYTGLSQVAPSETVKLLALSVTAVPGLDVDRILTLSDDAELNYFAGALWVDNLPELVTSLLGRSLDATGHFEVLAGRRGTDTENCSLDLELQEFYALLSPGGQASTVQVTINGRYQCESASPVMLQLSASIPVNDHRMSVVVAAFQQAMDDVTRDMLDQLR